MIRYLVSLCAVATSVFAVADADAVEVLSAEELASHCAAFPDDPDSVDGQYCIRYIQDFIDGAVTTDVRVMMNMESESGTEESFSQRAIRTRSIDRDSLRRAAGYAEFCLGDPVPLVEVVRKIVADLDDQVDETGSSDTARDAVYDSLRRHYPCDAG